MRLKFTYIFTIAILLQLSAFSQIKVTIEDIQDEMVLLTAIKGGKNFIIDTLVVVNEKIKIPEALLSENRIYALTIPSLKYEKLEFIYEGEKFEMITSIEDLLGSVEIINNFSTTLLYSDLKKNLKLLNKLNELSINNFDVNSILREDSLLNQIKNNRKELIDKNPLSLWAQLNKIDSSAELPYFGNKAYNELMSKYSDFEGGKGSFIKDIYLENDILFSTKSFERRIAWMINHKENYNNDSMILYMDSLLTTIVNNSDLYNYALRIYFDRFNTLEDHKIEKAMIHFWHNYLKEAKGVSIDELDKWKFGKLIGIREHSLVGEKLVEFEARDEFFNKVTQDDIEGEKRILVFWNPSWQAHWVNIAYWRDDFNESGIYNDGFRLIFIGVKNDEYKWQRAVEKLQINDKPQYLNRLNEPVFKFLFDSDLKIEFPFTYLIDENGIVIDKFKPDVLDYSKYTN